MKSGLSVSIETKTLVKVQDIAIERRAKLSPIVQEILELGTQEYEKREDDRRYESDLKAAKEIERIKGAKPICGGNRLD